MASPVDDPKSYLTLAQAAWALLVFGVGVGAGYTNLKRDVARAKERHDERDEKFEKLEEKQDSDSKRIDQIERRVAGGVRRQDIEALNQRIDALSHATDQKLDLILEVVRAGK